MNDLKSKLKDNQLLIGGWITLYHPAIAEIFSNADFDWVAVDLEHSVITIREAEELIRVIELNGTSPLVRLSSIDAVQIKRVMDAGAQGIIVPMVKGIDDINEINKALFYPPKGTRGVGLARAQKYGADFDGYMDRINDDVVFIPQIEHIDSVNNIEAILTHESVDAYLLGPYDLSASMSIPGQFDHPDFKNKINEVMQAGNKFGKPGGIHTIEPDVTELKSRINDGFKFIAYSLDIRILDSVIEESLLAVKKR